MKLQGQVTICRFGVPASRPTPLAPQPVLPAPQRGLDFVQQVISDTAQPVVLFALEWCEFSWSVRRFFKDRGIPFRSVDLDSVVLQKDNLAGDIRKALHTRTGQPTIPQIFVGGHHVGGAVDVLSRHDAGELDALLDSAGISPTAAVPSAQGYLPKWLASRAV